MSQFLPITLVFAGGLTITASSLRQASDALKQPGWADEEGADLLLAARLVEEAIHGTCSPKIAFKAFAAAAHKRGLVLHKPKSRAWAEFEQAIHAAPILQR